MAALSCGKACSDGVNRVDDVRARLAEDNEQRGRFAVRQAERPQRFATESVTLATSLNRTAAPFPYFTSRRLVVHGVHQLVIGRDQPAILPVRESSFG